MNKEHDSDATMARKSFRPVLMASRNTVTQYAGFLGHLLAGLADESISAVLVCPPGYDTASLVSAPVTAMIHPPMDLPLLRQAGLGALRLQLERFKPTVVHGLCESQWRLTRRLTGRLDVPYVQMVNSLPTGLSTFSTASARCAAIVVSAETIKACWPSADRVRRINMGAFVAEEVACFSDSSQLPSIVIAEPLHRVSDFEAFFRAVKNLLADGYEFMVVVMGTGTGEHRLRRFLADGGLSWAVTIVPTLNPWRCVLGAGDIFVQPRPLRAFSGYMLEAMSVGTAVAACLGGVDDLIIPNQTAVVFEPDDEPSIRQALTQLLDAHDFARRLAKTAQEHVRVCHSVSAMVSATLATYAEAHQGHRD